MALDRCVTLATEVTEEEAGAIRAAAERARMTVSDYLRGSALVQCSIRNKLRAEITRFSQVRAEIARCRGFRAEILAEIQNARCARANQLVRVRG